MEHIAVMCIGSQARSELRSQHDSRLQSVGQFVNDLRQVVVRRIHDCTAVFAVPAFKI
jgi:hypothetical protein